MIQRTIALLSCDCRRRCTPALLLLSKSLEHSAYMHGMSIDTYVSLRIKWYHGIMASCALVPDGGKKTQGNKDVALCGRRVAAAMASRNPCMYVASR